MTDQDKPWSRWTAATVMAKSARKSWWRCNVWGLVALLPALAVIVALRFDDIYWAYWRSQPLVPLNASQQEWLSFGGARMRLVEFEPVTDLVRSGGKPFELPAGIKPWRAVIEFKAPDQDSMAGCKIFLEDRESRLYSMRPEELDAARGIPFSTCTAPRDAASTDYSAAFLFVMPSAAKPVAVHVSWSTRFPEFARLSIAG